MTRWRMIRSSSCVCLSSQPTIPAFINVHGAPAHPSEWAVFAQTPAFPARASRVASQEEASLTPQTIHTWLQRPNQRDCLVRQFRWFMTAVEQLITPCVIKTIRTRFAPARTKSSSPNGFNGFQSSSHCESNSQSEKQCNRFLKVYLIFLLQKREVPSVSHSCLPPSCHGFRVPGLRVRTVW